MRKGLKAVFIANLGDGGICVPKVVKDTFFATFQHPFVDGLMEYGSKYASERNGGIAPNFANSSTVLTR